LSWEQEVLLDRFGGENCYAEEKERQVLSFLDERGGTLHAFYSDHISDLGLLRRAEKAVAVNPSPRLRRAARQMGIPVEDWNR
jgi:phosphatidylglycerophosphatase C